MADFFLNLSHNIRNPSPNLKSTLPDACRLITRKPMSQNPHSRAPKSQTSRPPPPTERVSAVVDKLSGLTLLEVMELSEMLRQKLGIENMPAMAVVTPGIGFAGAARGAKGGGGPAAGKATFALKLSEFDAPKKLKVVQLLRTLTTSTLVEAKKLVENAPGFFKKGVTKEEAEEIVKKMAEAGAKVTTE